MKAIDFRGDVVYFMTKEEEELLRRIMRRNVTVPECLVSKGYLPEKEELKLTKVMSGFNNARGWEETKDD